jgi:hypothetical protein
MGCCDILVNLTCWQHGHFSNHVGVTIIHKWCTITPTKFIGGCLVSCHANGCKIPMLWSWDTTKDMSMEKSLCYQQFFLPCSCGMFSLNKNHEIIVCVILYHIVIRRSHEWIFLEDFCSKSNSLNRLENFL